MKNKVLIISYQFPPSASSGVFRTIRFVKNLPIFGWTPLVLTVRPEYYPSGMPIDHELISSHSALNEVKVWRTGCYGRGNQKIRNTRSSGVSKALKTSSNPKSVFQKIKRILSHLLYVPDRQNTWIFKAVKTGQQIIQQENADVIYATGRPWSSFIIGYFLSKRNKLPLVIDFRDPWVDNPYSNFEYRFIRRIHEFLEKKCIVAANLVIANTEPLKDLLTSKYNDDVQSSKFVTITNGYDESEFEKLDIKRNRTYSNAPIVITHVGAIYSKRTPENFLLALSSLIDSGVLKQTDVVVRLIGKIKDLKIDDLRKQAEGVQLELVGQVSKREALQASMDSDVLLLLQPDTDLQIPAKLYEYARLQRKILAICGEGATKQIVIENGLGLAANYYDIRDIQNKILKLVLDFKGGVVEGVPRHSNYAIFNGTNLCKELVRNFNNLLLS